MATPGKGRPSGIPAPGKSNTPARSRSTSNVNQTAGSDAEYMSRAFADAIRANDPAQHRSHLSTGHSPTSVSPQSTSGISLSESRSNLDRPSSVASNYSNGYSRPYYERAKTPTSIRPPSRPPSRHSDIFGRSPSRSFEVGDNVRIESLGFEGILRYIGEIDGKLGLWAGVELSGGFSGKGKNNGCVNGKQYFSCPEHCGVFVATTKLSPPTVGHNATQRPSSVASSRKPSSAAPGRISRTTSVNDGRITPSLPGRITPSLLNGRVTPGASTRIKPGALSKSTTTKVNNYNSQFSVTPGSKPAIHTGLTATQLKSRDAININTTQRPSELSFLQSSPSQVVAPSPTRSQRSPLNTPKPLLYGRTPGKSRPSAQTPRARIPSAIAMPPPSSPHIRSEDTANYSAEDVPPANVNDSPGYEDGSCLRSRPQSAASNATPNEPTLVEQLKSRVEALEYENERLRTIPAPPANLDINIQVEGLQQERDKALEDLNHANSKTKELQTLIDTRDSKITSMEQVLLRASTQQQSESQAAKERITALQIELETSSRLVGELQEAARATSLVRNQQEVDLNARQAELLDMKNKVDEAYATLEDEKRELGAQIDELREAGQETIALYEERLSAADSQRYELESRISSLELKDTEDSVKPLSPSRNVVSATQIDNETLKDQVLHLQRKIAIMEDQMEDARATSEREEAAVRDKLRRLKEKEEVARREVLEGRKEVERMLKSETTARNRVDELDEALRESTLALENARAEVEVLRLEITNLDGLVANTNGVESPARVAETSQSPSADITALTSQIQKLRAQIDELRDHERIANEQWQSSEEHLAELRGQHALLQQSNDEKDLKLATLTQTLENNPQNLSPATPVRSGFDLPKVPHNHPQHPILLARKITGLKHIVQELQKENFATAQKNKLLESENQLLLSEADQLRQEVRILEDNLDKSLLDETSVPIDLPPGSPDINMLQKSLKDQASRFEIELEQLRKRLADNELKSARIAHDLNKEINELEALVEAKIYREEELEQELERLTERLARYKKHRKGRQRDQSSVDNASNDPQQMICEICERPGHDIFNCELLKDDVPSLSNHSARNSIVSVELFCEDCESHGHVAADCPHSLDVF
ncbi:hypothetical protein BD779DRAFT_1661531 [Infundibulicybe gibba]|nr:hypothetical protein BD779DRAFT_1661531 [Infundibulicybe gibba]